MSAAAILGCAMAVPGAVLRNDQLPASLHTSDEWIRQRTGIAERRIAAADEATSTFAIRASRDAIVAAGIAPSDIDLVLVATCTPDTPVPGTAPLVQDAIGATHAGAMDLNAGCSGFVSALSLASATVAAGQARHVLVCGVDVLSRITDWTDRTTAVLFGDGGGAVVVGRSRGASRIGPFVHGSDGSRAADLVVAAGGSGRPADHASVDERAHTIRMRGQDVYKHACDRMTEAAASLLGEGDVDLVVAHQANARIVRTVADRLGIGWERFVCNVERYGNTSAGSIPIALAEAEADGRLRVGTRVLLVAFGAGFSWSAGLVIW